jgi:hypothetical protein
VLPDDDIAIFPFEPNNDVNHGAKTDSLNKSTDELVEETALEQFSAIL